MEKYVDMDDIEKALKGEDYCSDMQDIGYNILYFNEDDFSVWFINEEKDSIVYFDIDKKEFICYSRGNSRVIDDLKGKIVDALEGDKNVEILKSYGKYSDSYFSVNFVPFSVAQNLTEGITKLDLNESQNESPTMKELLELAKKYNGLLCGYVIPKASKREDYRINFDAIVLPITEIIAKKLKRKLKPDEFDKTKQGWRFWWD